MKFRDLFLPKIARSDPKARAEAVLEINDAAILKKVIENDESEEVREVARNQLEGLMVKVSDA